MDVIKTFRIIRKVETSFGVAPDQLKHQIFDFNKFFLVIWEINVFTSFNRIQMALTETVGAPTG